MRSRPSLKIRLAIQLAGMLVLLGGFCVNGETAPLAAATPNSKDNPTVIVFIGDSLTQGYGVRSSEAYPELVGVKLRERGLNVKTVNGGISGSVTAEGDRRLRWYLKAKPTIVVLALGANDGLKGTPPAVIESNLRKTIHYARANGITVLLAGIRMLSNLGADYVRQFDSVYPRLAQSEKVELIPFLLEDVALQKDLNQQDMRHPNAKGHEVIASRVADRLEKILRSKSSPRQKDGK